VKNGSLCLNRSSFHFSHGDNGLGVVVVVVVVIKGHGAGVVVVVIKGHGGGVVVVGSGLGSPFTGGGMGLGSPFTGCDWPLSLVLACPV
jgi:hypothetical protein